MASAWVLQRMIDRYYAETTPDVWYVFAGRAPVHRVTWHEACKL